MSKNLTFDLSVNSIKDLNKQINKLIKQIGKEVNTEFIRLSLEWIKVRAERYLRDSGHDLDLVNAIGQSWSIDLKQIVGRLINDYDKAAYIEFGVGEVGEQQAYPKTFATELHWEYNLPTYNKNYMTGEWSFVVDDYEIVDIRKENTTKTEEVDLGKTLITTRGNQGAMFMYNAMMDYANDISIPAKLYRQAFEKFA